MAEYVVAGQTFGTPDDGPPVHGDPLLVDHLEGSRRWRDRYRRAVERGNAEHAVGVSTSPVLTGEGAAGASRSPAPPLRPAPADPIVYVQWFDSSMCHEQVDGDRLPTPSVLHSVGWLAAESDEFVTIAREQNPDPDSYRWRGSVSIPRLAVLSIQQIGGASDG